MKNLQIVSMFPLKKPVIKRTHEDKAHQDKTSVGRLNPFRPDDG
jgi:hypothetical protein